MCSEKQTSSGDSDSLEVRSTARLFEKSATAWLLDQAVRYLNTDNKEGEYEYTRVGEILRRCSNDLLEIVNGIFHQVQGGDTTLRWNLLYVLGDVGDENAADFLVRAALKPLPEKKEREGCESDLDMDMLICTGAVHAFHRLATRHPKVAEHVLKIISEKPARPILIEAVKVAVDLGFRERVQHLLAKEDHWILDIRRARTQELFAEPEREDGKERGFTPPKSGSFYTAPRVDHCKGKEN